MNYIIIGEREVIRSIVRVIPREKISYETPSTIGDVELNFHQYWVTSGDVNYILIEFRDHAESADSNSFTVFSKEDPSFVRKVNWNKCDEMSFVAINMLNKLGDFKSLTDLMEIGLKSVPLSGIDKYYEEKKEVTEEEVKPTKDMEFLKDVNSRIKPYVDEVEEEMIMEIVKEEVQSFFDSTWVVRPGGRWLRRDLVIKLPDSNVMCKLNIDDNGFIQFGVESNNKIVFNSGKTIKKEDLTCTPDKDRIYYQLSSLGIMDNYIDTFQHSFLHTIRRAVHDKNMRLKIAYDIDGKDGEKFELYIYNSKEGVQINITKTSKDRKVQSRMNTVPHRNYVETATEDTYIDIERRYETTLVVTD